MTGGWAYRYRHEEVSASEAVRPMPGNPVKVILLYGSWNARFWSVQSDERPVAVPTLEKLRCSLLKEASSMGNNVIYLSVQVDEDDESLDVCTKSLHEGGLEAPSELPCLLLLAHHPENTTEANTNINAQTRIEYVECRNLEQVLSETIAAHDWELEQMEETPRSDLKRPSSIARENLATSLTEAWSRLFDAKGNLLPPQPKQKQRIAPTNTMRIKNNEPAIRIFVAGDKSQVGKSSICMVRSFVYLINNEFSQYSDMCVTTTRFLGSSRCFTEIWQVCPIRSCLHKAGNTM